MELVPATELDLAARRAPVQPERLVLDARLTVARRHDEQRCVEWELLLRQAVLEAGHHVVVLDVARMVPGELGLVILCHRRARRGHVEEDDARHVLGVAVRVERHDETAERVADEHEGPFDARGLQQRMEVTRDVLELARLVGGRVALAVTGPVVGAHATLLGQTRRERRRVLAILLDLAAARVDDDRRGAFPPALQVQLPAFADVERPIDHRAHERVWHDRRARGRDARGYRRRLRSR